MTIGGASTKDSGLGLQVLQSPHMAPSFVLTATRRSHAGDTELRTSRKVFRTADLPTACVVQAAASRPRHFRGHQTQTALLRAHVAIASALRHRGLSAHGVRRSASASRHTLLQQVWLDTVFLEGHQRFQRAAAQVFLRYTRDALGSRASRAETQCSLHGARCGCSGCPRRRSPCHNRITRVSGHPREKVTRFSEPRKKSNRRAVVHQQVGQSRQNQRAQTLTLKTCEKEKHHPARYATKNFMPPHCQFLTSKLQNDIICTTLRELIHCTPTHTLL